MGNTSLKRKREESLKSESSRGEDGSPVLKRRKVSCGSRRTGSRPTHRVGPKKLSNRGTKRRTLSFSETPRKKLKTEPVTVPHNVFPSSEAPPKPKHVLEPISREEYEQQYIEDSQLGEGGYGTVYSGYRKNDLLPVAIKHIEKDMVKYLPVVINGEQRSVPLEMVLMAMAAGDSVVGGSAVVSPITWLDLDYEVLLIMERPETCLSLIDCNNGQMNEGQAKELMRQLVEAAVRIHTAGVFHCDFKPENILLQVNGAWSIPRVRVIDFGCGWFVQPGYCSYSGTHCFRPPECDHRGIHEAGPTTVWQLGCTLLQMLGVKLDVFAKGQQHCEQFLMNIITELKVSEDCKRFLMCCLLVNPDQRLNLGQMWCHPWFH